MYSFYSRSIVTKRISSLGGAVLTIIATVACLTSTGMAQVFPSFPSGTDNTSTVVEYAPNMVPFGSSVYPNALFLTYVNATQPNNLGVAYSLDGSNFTNLGSIVDSNTGARYNVNCNAGLNGATCAPAVAVYGPNAYIAFADQNTGGLDVVQVNTIPGNAGWTYQQVYTNTSVQLTSAPAMAVSPDGSQLIIRYGTSNNPNLKNVTYNTTYNANGNLWSTFPSNAYAPTQSAMVLFNGTLYAIDKQNNSNNGVFVSQIDNNGVYIPGTASQISGWYTPAGISATVFNGSIVAAIQSNSSNHDLWVFSSSNGSNWSGHDYGSSIRIGATPSITAYNGGVSVSFKANDSSNTLFASFATQ